MYSVQVGNIRLFRFEAFCSYPVFDFTTTIDTGVSNGNYSTFNLAYHSGDKQELVLKNRVLLCQALEFDLANLVVPFQQHTDQLCIIDDDFLSLEEEDRQTQLSGIDALITNLPNIAIGILTADCVPLTIFDPVNRVIGVVHAGWKGTVSHLAVKTVLEMVDRFGSKVSNLLIGIGPSISPDKFEVGEELGLIFQEAQFDLCKVSFRNSITQKLHIDLWEANRLDLLSLGVQPQNIEIARICTYSNPDSFFSARRQTIHSGRMISGIMLSS